MRIAYKHPIRKRIIQYETREKLYKWVNNEKEYYLIGSCAIPTKDVKEIDKTTLKAIHKIEKQIAKQQAKTQKLLDDNYHMFKEVK